MVLAFLAQHSLPFSLAPELISLAKALNLDAKALGQLTMDRTSASYKLRFGLGHTVHHQLISALQREYFSLNIDESTSTNHQRVLCVLASYYSPLHKQVIVQHLESLVVIKVDSASLHQELVDLLKKYELPWKNCISILMDSCSVMRGSKSGVEVRIRENNAPHMLDIDGDSCHHAHNASKKLSDPFDNFAERMLSDIYNDFKWSPDLKQFLQEICGLIGVRYTMPERYVSHRWLSVYDVSVDTLRLWDAFVVFYFGFLSQADRTHYLSRVVEVYHRRHVDTKAKERIRQIHDVLKKKNMTKDGKARKERILQRVFHKKKLMRLILMFYTSVFPLLKKYVLLFEMKAPLIHKLNDQQVDLVREFMACFVKPEKLPSSGKRLQTLDLDEKANLLQVKKMFLGVGVSEIVNTARSGDGEVHDFLQSVEKAYVTCGKYLQKKMPLHNAVLRSASAIDPLSRGHTVSQEQLLKLPRLVTNVLAPEECDAFELEVRSFQIDSSLPPAQEDESARIDDWWTKVFEGGKYPLLSRMVKALLSCFHGPQVESAFNLMGDVLDVRSHRLNMETYSAVMGVKYNLRSSGKTAVEYYSRTDKLHSPIDLDLCKNMRGAYKTYKAELADRRDKEEERRREVGAAALSKLTKRKTKELTEKAAKKARLSHQRASKKKHNLNQKTKK